MSKRSELGYHEHEDVGLVAIDLWPHGLDDGSPAQGFLSHPERSGADLASLVTGADESGLDSAFWEALAVDTDEATAWAFARGFEWADDEPLERTPEGVDKARVAFLLLPASGPP